jgi:hypothetical protein
MAPPHHATRFSVVLPDPKAPGSDKDMVFLPDQFFGSPVEAKNAAALLPLLHFCSERPLERKLPDPFREMWLALVASAGAPKAVAPVVARPPPVPTARPPPPLEAAAAVVAAPAVSGMGTYSILMYCVTNN